jgi:SHAQKYF class myb-like DNA-binding protein
LCN